MGPPLAGRIGFAADLDFRSTKMEPTYSIGGLTREQYTELLSALDDRRHVAEQRRMSCEALNIPDNVKYYADMQVSAASLQKHIERSHTVTWPKLELVKEVA
jgi:hypothetical protein